MFSSTFRIASIRGIDVRMAPSWLLVAAAIVWAYQRSFAGADRSVLLTVAMAVTVGVLFTASVLLHEVAHALEGTHRGVEVGGITLFMLGGATSLRDPDRRPGDEFAIAAVGPWTNVVLAAVFGLVAVYAAGWGMDAVADIAGLMGWLNLGLAAFNLIPGAPLDGGRVLRAAIWAVTGDRHRSTVIAATVGIALSVALVGWGLWLVVRSTGGLTAGIWLGLIGAYILRAARVELSRGRLATWLAGFDAGVLAPAVPRLAADATVEELRTVLATGPPAVLLDRGGEPVGVVVAHGDGAPPLEGGTTAADHATPLDELPSVAHDDPGDRLVGLLDRDQPLVLVVGPAGTWLSTLHLIDRRIGELRSGDVPAARRTP